jgi:tetratricopeptide (TPR) repeat protein
MWEAKMCRSIRAMACVFLMLLSTAALGQATQQFQFAEKAGPHAVGLKVVQQYDYSRTWRSAVNELGQPYTGERARPLQTLIWYPAKSGGTAMTVHDYAVLRLTETDFGKKPAPNEVSPQDEGRKETFKDHMLAVRDAAPDEGRFPVVIYAPSFSNTAWENADLCEYLASYGYVVLASPDMGATTRGMTGDLAGIEAQARDISFLIGYASTLPDTEMSQVAVGGFSWGGISNFFAAARDNRIKALFALDGSLRYFPGLIKQSGYARPDQMKIPLLFFTQGDISLEEQEHQLNDPERMSGHNALNAWTHGDLITVHMLGLTHGEFSSMFQRDENFWKGSEKYMKADYTRADGITGYAWVARYTEHFLDGYLKHDAAALDWLKKKPGDNGAPPHFLTASYRASSGTPPTLDSFREELHEKGFDHAGEVYASFQKQDSTFKLDEGFINQWGYELMNGNHYPEAVEVFKFNVSLNPNSGNAYDSLAEAYMKSGDKQHAIEFYKKSLEKDPSNDNAKDKLKELEPAPVQAKAEK